MISLVKHFALFAAILGLGGALLVLFGIVPINASSGHWAITEWFLNFAKKQSVATHSWSIEPPPLEDPQLIVRGAGAYEVNCRGCHGSPLLPNPVLARKSTPAAPFLPMTLGEWESHELFYIVKHGIKLTAMPAWPSQTRDDEVWAMVAFLEALPGLDGNRYGELVAENIRVEPTNECQRCHGPDGLGRNGAFPKLAEQRQMYIENALKAFASEERNSGVMAPIAAELVPDRIRELALYYSTQTDQTSASQAQDSSSVERGRIIAEQGIPGQRVPSCQDCHGPEGSQRNPAYPKLQGQYPDYLTLQLRLFKSNNRGGSPYADMMQPISTRLTDEQIRDVAAYYGSLR